LKQRIAFFDFDGTITTKDTLLEFIKYSKGNGLFYFGFLLNSPWLLAYKLKVISNSAAKEKVLRFFFRNTPLAAFQQQCDQFAAEIIPSLVRPKAEQEIKQLIEKGFAVVIVSASPGNWIRGWAEQMNAKLLATRLETGSREQLTGRIQGANCHGEEKVRRIKEAYSLPDYEEIYAYGDTKGDWPMLKLATARFFKPFR
jgi:phosphatidylglycerophosphatase C